MRASPPASSGEARPRVVVVGLGPSGPDLVPGSVIDALRGAARCLVRTARHPSAGVVGDVATGPVETLDRLYDAATNIEDVYVAIVEAVVHAAHDMHRADGDRTDGDRTDGDRTDGDRTGGDPADGDRYVAYAVPGSPLVAERSVALLRADTRVTVSVVVAPSFLDLAWERLGVDPVAAGVRIVDALTFASGAAGERGPMLVAQCHSRSVLSEIKLAADDLGGADPERRAVLLHHLGLDDERVLEVAWPDLDRSIEPDHLTALWVPRLAAPVAAELVALEELVRTLRARCPWDQIQTHGSLGRHLLEEAYEALDAIEAVAGAEPEVPAEAVAHLEEELGDLLFQVYFHALLATEEGRFTLADVAKGLHDKLVHRHPHVFGDAAAETPEDVAARWEVLKKAEKGRTSVTDGIPAALPALALSAKLQRKAESVGIDTGTLAERCGQVRAGLDQLLGSSRPSGGPGGPGGGGDGPGAAPHGSGETLDASPQTVAVMGEMLFALADAARRLGVDPESALRNAAGDFRRRLEASEAGPA